MTLCFRNFVIMYLTLLFSVNAFKNTLFVFNLMKNTKHLSFWLRLFSFEIKRNKVFQRTQTVTIFKTVLMLLSDVIFGVRCWIFWKVSSENEVKNCMNDKLLSLISALKTLYWVCFVSCAICIQIISFWNSKHLLSQTLYESLQLTHFCIFRFLKRQSSDL